MLGWVRLKLEPRLDGVVVVGGAGGVGAGWVGRRFAWGRVRLVGGQVSLVDEEGRALRGAEGGRLRASWVRESVGVIARRAWERAARRELAAGSLDRVFRTDSPAFARVYLAVCGAIGAFCLASVVMAGFGVSVLFRIGPSPTVVDRLLAAGPWCLWLLMLGVCAWIVRPVAVARWGRLRVTGEGMELEERGGVRAAWAYSEMASLGASFVVDVTMRDGRRARVTFALGLPPLVRLIAEARFPAAVGEERAGLRRTARRAVVIWVVGCVVCGVVMAWLGVGPRILVANPTLNAVLVTGINMVTLPLLAWLAVWGRARFQPWLQTRLERRARASRRGGRVLEVAKGLRRRG